MRLLLVDDHDIVREGIRRSFEAAGETIVAEADNGERGVELALVHRPDVTIMDVAMPVLDGVEATRRLCGADPGARVVVLTMHDDVGRTRAAIEAGATAFLSKGSSFSSVLETVRVVAAGDTVLSPSMAASMLSASAMPVDTGRGEGLLSERQTEILQGIADGQSTKQVALALGITPKTVHNHLNAAYRRLDAQSLTHAVLSAVRLGIVDLHGALV